MIVKEKPPPLPEKDIVKKVKKRLARANRILEHIKEQKNVDWDSKGRFVPDKELISSSNITDLLNSALHERNFEIPGWKSLILFLNGRLCRLL